MPMEIKPLEFFFFLEKKTTRSRELKWTYWMERCKHVSGKLKKEEKKEKKRESVSKSS